MGEEAPLKRTAVWIIPLNLVQRITPAHMQIRAPVQRALHRPKIYIRAHAAFRDMRPR